MGPVRKIGKSHRAVNGTLAPYAGGDRVEGSAQFESTLERDCLVLLEFDPAVEKVVTQPLKLAYRLPSGARRIYTPDLLVHYRDGRVPGLFEVKYVEDVRAKRDEMAWRFRAARAHARQQGWTFTLLTERVLRGQHLENARFLRPFLRRSVDAPTAAEILGLVTGSTTPRAVLARLPDGEQGQWLPVLWHLVAARRIACDLEALLSLDVPIWPVDA